MAADPDAIRRTVSHDGPGVHASCGLIAETGTHRGEASRWSFSLARTGKGHGGDGHYWCEEDQGEDRGWPNFSGTNSSFFGAPASDPVAESYVINEDGWDTCRHCGSYLVEEDNDTDTEDEIGENMDEDEYYQFTGFVGDEDYEILRSDYLYARRRFRAFTQKHTRHDRFPRRASWSMGKRKGQFLLRPKGERQRQRQEGRPLHE